MKIAMEFEDGRRFEATANEKTFRGIATKSAFKKQFGVPFIVTGLWSQVFVDGDDGEESKLDLSQVSADQLQYLDDEHLAFLVWMELKRRCDDLPDGSWDKIVPQIADVEMDFTDEEEGDDRPT